MKPWKDTPDTCATCGIRHPQKLICQLTGQAVTDNDFCSKHQEILDVCDLCNKFTTLTLIHKEGEKNYFICQNCFSSFSTCRMCASGKHCAFEADTTLPKIVTQTIRQGHMVMQTQVRNPELVKKTCEAGCKCYDKAGQYCRREDGYCIEHDFQSPF